MKTRIKELRARHDLTQDDLANKLGVTRATVWFMEKWKYNPSLKLAKKVSLVLGESIDFIFIFDDEELDLK